MRSCFRSSDSLPICPSSTPRTSPRSGARLELFACLGPDPWSTVTLDYARRHHDVVARFGRFPHRNAVLGRASTPEELAFLQQPGSSF
ncbi:MAG: DUF924 domain-containing protein [Burkholderiales bacterium]|nr:DUF924 domain-containing protein [Burkholderiales bacterium]